MSLTKTTFSMTSGAVTNVFDFGAKGDGVTDDTAAIQAAITYTLTKSKTSTLNQLGGVVYFPTGRYRITSTLTNVTDGITIRGEPSGLDSVPVAQATSGSMIFCDNSVTGFPMFTINDGGPITIQDIGLNGTQTITNSTCILSGTGATNVGLTQAHFSNVRFTGFSTVISANKFFDVTFYDCGFEANTLCFNFIGGAYTTIGEIKFVSSIFFGNSVCFQGSANAIVLGMTFASCIFQASGQIQQIFVGYDGTFQSVALSACHLTGYSGTPSESLFCSLPGLGVGYFNYLSISGCVFNKTNFGYFPNNGYGPQGQFINYSGNIFQDSSFTSTSTVTSINVSNNTFNGTSVLALNGITGSVINSNECQSATTNPPFALTGVFTSLCCSNNLFASPVTTLSLNVTSTRVKMIGNVYIADVTYA